MPLVKEYELRACRCGGTPVHYGFAGCFPGKMVVKRSSLVFVGQDLRVSPPVCIIVLGGSIWLIPCRLPLNYSEFAPIIESFERSVIT